MNITFQEERHFLFVLIGSLRSVSEVELND